MSNTLKRRLIGVCLLFCATFFVVATTQAGDAPQLSTNDCIKCHSSAPRDIAANGGKHRDSITCLDCHQGHPPSVREIIPKCSECHADKPHFEQEGCLGCHTNPHTPLQITFTGELTTQCLACHTEQNDQLKKYPSKHSLLSCSKCHTAHGLIPQCTKCHQPHKEGQEQKNCLTCHQVHMPREVSYPDDVDSVQCSACHDTAYKLLTASPAKHSKLLCAACHQQKHKMVPECQMCHGVPHPESILAKFPQCGNCHGIAHDLNR